MIICVVGPTGVGKTRLSEELSVKYNGIIINSDAMQVYKEMDIGTAKYKSSEDKGAKHYLFDIKEVKDNYTVYDYQKDARRIIDSHPNQNVIMVGGTGLYLKACLYDYEFKERALNQYEEYSNEELFAMLQKMGKSDGVHPNNRRRLISKLNSNLDANGKDKLLYDDVIIVGLTTDRENLYSIIDKRVDEMLESGLLEEVKNLYDKYGMTKALNTAIGYKELIGYLNKEMTLEDTVSLIKQRSRKYAKRQYTWFNHQMKVNWFSVNYENFDETINQVIKFIDNRILQQRTNF